MSKLIDLAGKKFGRLTVIERDYSNPRNKENSMWLCKCECGTEKIIRSGDLRNGLTQSCGCLRKENAKSGDSSRLTSGLASIRKLIRNYKRRAKENGLDYKLTDEQFKEITQENCHYCGAKPNNITKSPTQNGDYIYNGLDRIDNFKGYMIDNVVPCCKQCNTSKNILTLEKYKDWIRDSYNKIFREKK